MAARSRKPSAPAPSVAVPPARGAVALLLFIALFSVYLLNWRLRGAGDSIATRLLPFSVLREGDLDLDEFTWHRTAQGRLPYYVHAHGGSLYPVSTVATALVVTPLYVAPAWWLAHAGVDYDDVRARVVAAVMERVSAAALTALSASVLFLALCRLTRWRAALGLTLLYALGTSTWSIASQAMWPHALAELCLATLCLILLDANPSRRGLALAGLVAALAVANRPQALVFAGVAAAFVAVRRRADLLAFLAAPLALGAAVAAYNLAIFSALAGGYGGLRAFDAPLAAGLAGLLISPNRGLLVFTPVLAFSLWGALRVWRVAEAPPWLRWLTIGVGLHLLVHAAFREWWAGYTYGPRYLTDVLPALVLFLVYGLLPYWRRPALRVLAVTLAAYGVIVQGIGVYAADDGWNRTPVPLEHAPGRVWDWRDLQIVRSARNGWRGDEYLAVMWDAFTDTVPARVAALAPDDLTADVRVLEVPTLLPAGAPASVRVAVTNRAAQAWPAFTGEAFSDRYLVFVLARWFAADVPVAGAGDVVRLPTNLAPGETDEVRLSLVAPLAPGAYEIELRVTQAIDGARGVVGPGAVRVPVRVQ